MGGEVLSLRDELSRNGIVRLIGWVPRIERRHRHAIPNLIIQCRFVTQKAVRHARESGVGYQTGHLTLRVGQLAPQFRQGLNLSGEGDACLLAGGIAFTQAGFGGAKPVQFDTILGAIGTQAGHVRGQAIYLFPRRRKRYDARLTRGEPGQNTHRSGDDSIGQQKVAFDQARQRRTSGRVGHGASPCRWWLKLAREPSHVMRFHHRHPVRA